MDPIVHEVEKNYKQQINFVYVDLAKSSGRRMASKAGIRGIPTILLFDSAGDRTNTLVGTLSRAALEGHLEALLQ